ncbi:MucB/RseB C-terminal domain-containing protein [Litoribrevibacter euphylliae]|uniref:MucB/RseB C-terminal domain-containing protein n=2 Tax=Litoribrevibacter euphylliae TaxID=1834034 RepID=A0ABV7HB08_9GAMM
MTPIELLSMLDEARKENSFIGTFIHRRGDSVNSYHIVHGIQDGVQYERLKSLDGAPREILRDGESVTCILPEDVGSRWDQIPPLSPLVPGENVDWKEIQKWLKFTILSHSWIAGREAILIEAQSIEQDRFIRRYGIDAETGLLLKTEILNSEGRSLELAQFTQIKINPSNLKEELAPTLKGKVTKFDRRHWNKSATTSVNWKPDWLPSGFHLTGVTSGEDKNFVEAYTYSDGLSSFSIFREQPSAQFVEMEGRGGGATVAVSRVIETEKGEKWGITLVGEIPVETAKRVASSVSMLN